MKAMIVGDVHLADKPPSIRTETYTTDILDKVSWISQEAYRQGCDFILQLGDMFHIKSPYRNSHALVIEAHEALIKGGLPVLLVPGNHDIQNDRLASIASQPLGALARMEGIRLVIGWDEKFSVFGIPYLQDWTTLPERLMEYSEGLDPDSAVNPLIATHAPIFPPGETPPYDYIDPTDIAELLPAGGTVSYGHIHDPHGVYEVGGVTFANFGAISRGSLHAETLKRKPQVAVYDFLTGTYEAVPVPHKPAEEVFRLELHEAEKSKEAHLAAFLATLDSDTLELTTVEKVLDDLDKLDLTPEAREVAKELVEKAYAEQ